MAEARLALRSYSGFADMLGFDAYACASDPASTGAMYGFALMSAADAETTARWRSGDHAQKAEWESQPAKSQRVAERRLFSDGAAYSRAIARAVAGKSRNRTISAVPVMRATHGVTAPERGSPEQTQADHDIDKLELLHTEMELANLKKEHARQGLEMLPLVHALVKKNLRRNARRATGGAAALQRLEQLHARAARLIKTGVQHGPPRFGRKAKDFT